MKAVLITGAGAGIGRALAVEYCSRGFKVYATDIVFSQETLNFFTEEDKKGDGRIITRQLDVTRPEDISEVWTFVKGDHGNKLDILYCNAGIAQATNMTDVTDEQIDKIYQVNLFGPMRLVRQFSKMVINAHGTIAFSGSVAKSLPVISHGLYGSSKAALDEYAYCLHTELKQYDVKVVDVVGGYIDTGLLPRYAGNDDIPESSIYKFEEYLQRNAEKGRIMVEEGARGMPVEVFAKRVVDQLESCITRDTVRIFEGHRSGRADVLSKLAPAGWLANRSLKKYSLDFDYRAHLEVGDKFEPECGGDSEGNGTT